MSGIASVWAREILDAQGNPIIEVEVGLDAGHTGRASVPTSLSTSDNVDSKHDAASAYADIARAIDHVNGEMADTLFGMDALKQVHIDTTLVDLDDIDGDYTETSIILGVSLACARAAANYLALPLYQYLGGVNAKVLPVPLMTIMSGGAHASNALDIQEFMLLPLGAQSFDDAMRMGAETFTMLRTLLHTDGFSADVGTEGRFAPELLHHDQAFSYIVRAIEEAGYTPWRDIALGINVASSKLYHDKKYSIASEGKKLSSQDMVHYLGEFVAKYPIISIEDGLAENDWEGWSHLTMQLGSRIQLVGDDIFVTNPDILAQGIAENVGNSILIKPHQIGTISETLDTIELARQHGYTTIISHHAGETEDPFIADLAVGTNAGQIKTGSLGRTDRLVKYNQFLRIEEELEDMALYYGGTMSDHYGECNEDEVQ